MAIFGVEPGIDGDERSGEDAFSEEILQNIGNAEGGAEGVGGVGIAKVVCEDAVAHQPDQAAEKDTDGYEKRMRLCRRSIR